MEKNAERIAILVIHGIGQQAPYETLDQFTQGLIRCFPADAKCTARPHLDISADPLREQNDWVRASCSLDFAPPVKMQSDTAEIGQISLFEYYWAPITQDKISYWGSLLFLIKTGLTPFKYLAANVTVLSAIGRRKRIPIVLLKEIWRQCALFLPLLALMVAIAAFLAYATPARLMGIYHELTRGSLLLAAILVVRYLYLWTVAGALYGSLKGKEGWQTSALWRLCLVLALAANIIVWPLLMSPVLAALAAVGRHLTLLRIFGPWASVARQLAHETMPPVVYDWKGWLNTILFLKPHLVHYHYLSIVACAALAYFVRFILIDYVGDIAVYVNADEFSSSFKARAQILDECAGTLTRLLQTRMDPQNPASPYTYDRVLIAGHSLGSVVAYDTLNELLDRARSSNTGAHRICSCDLYRLRGLVTFGCPLNKIFYFFREHIPPAQSVRRQLLDVLHGFRIVDALKASSGQSSGPLSTDEDPRWIAAEKALASGFRWINAFALADPISGRLSFYDLQGDENQKIFTYLKPGLAHIQYWNDPNFYSFVRSRLL